MGEAALLRACREMRQAEKEENWEAADIVGTPAEYWLGNRRVASTTVNTGIWLMVLSGEGIGTDYERYTLNERGRIYAEHGTLPEINT